MVTEDIYLVIMVLLGMVQNAGIDTTVKCSLDSF